ncbi:hypothetical protein GGI35DRAFT_454153 [Trichoderma velutinum]
MGCWLYVLLISGYMLEASRSMLSAISGPRHTHAHCKASSCRMNKVKHLSLLSRPAHAPRFCGCMICSRGRKCKENCEENVSSSYKKKTPRDAPAPPRAAFGRIARLQIRAVVIRG